MRLGGVEIVCFHGMKKLFETSYKCLLDTFSPAVSVLFLSGMVLKYASAVCFQVLFLSTAPPCSEMPLAVAPAPVRDHRVLGC